MRNGDRAHLRETSFAEQQLRIQAGTRGKRMPCGEWINCSKREKVWVVDADLKGLLSTAFRKTSCSKAVAETQSVMDRFSWNCFQRFSSTRGYGESGKRLAADRKRGNGRQGAVISPILAKHLLESARTI